MAVPNADNLSLDSTFESARAVDPDGRESSPLLLAAAIGTPLGTVSGAATCYVTGFWDDFWMAVLLGMFVGALIGTMSIRIDQQWHGRVRRRDVGTLVGIILGLLPAAIMVFRLAGELRITLLAGAVFIGPMAGLLLGAIFDRAIDELRDRRFVACITFVLFGIGLCCGLVSFIDRAAYGPPPEEMVETVEGVITDRWRDEPDVSSASIEHLTLARNGRRGYRGTFDMKIGEFTILHDLEVRDEGDSVFVSWEPQGP